MLFRSVRAPLGNFFPYTNWKGKNIFFVGGGIGMAPICIIMLHLLEHRADYGRISLLYGAKSPKDIAYSYETKDWLKREDLDCTLCMIPLRRAVSLYRLNSLTAPL